MPIATKTFQGGDSVWRCPRKSYDPLIAWSCKVTRQSKKLYLSSENTNTTKLGKMWGLLTI